MGLGAGGVQAHSCKWRKMSAGAGKDGLVGAARMQRERGCSCYSQGKSMAQGLVRGLLHACLLQRHQQLGRTCFSVPQRTQRVAAPSALQHKAARKYVQSLKRPFSALVCHCKHLLLYNPLPDMQPPAKGHTCSSASARLVYSTGAQGASRMAVL